ncbi:MAG: hypothetical protein FWG44_04560 [Oscillospiraceae bacterium]|nr:hypothetical protein [Oscillospiraceae bacterium]
MKSFKQTSYKVAYCGIICALSVMFMLISLVPGFTYAVPAVSGILIWSISIFINYKWALLAFASSALLTVLMIPEMEAKTVFIAFFGYYPIIRDKLAAVKPGFLRFIIKLAIFNAACVASFRVLSVIIGLDRILEGMEFMGDFAKYGLWGAANITFLCYELCLSQLYYVMERWVKPKFFKRIK